jgi:hypothetical protein
MMWKNFTSFQRTELHLCKKMAKTTCLGLVNFAGDIWFENILESSAETVLLVFYFM